MALNVTTAVIGSGCNTATATPSLAQWDQGQILKIEGVDLPAAYQVEFSTEYTRNAIQKIGNANGVAVPNELLQRSAPITAYIVLHEGENDRETEYWITIHITPRTPPETITPDPEEQSVIDETIAALQDGVAAAQAAAESVQNMGVEAETLAAGSAASVEKTVDPETGEVTLTFGIPRGNQGNPGTTPDFQIGTVETLPPTSPATATITGTPAEPVLNLGIPQGPKGDPGGSTGTTDYRELENKPQINGHTLNGDQSASDLGLGTYSKPGTGIPKTDLASDVQQSLDKADSALQSAPVSSVAGKTGAVQLNAGDIEFDDSETYAAGSIGAEVSQQKNAISQLGDIAAFKTAILQLAQKVAYIDEHGQDYYDDLYNALYGELVSISAVLAQNAEVYITDDIAVLKQYLTVTAVYAHGSAVISPDDYSLSGAFTPGASTITVTYGNKTATVSVTPLLWDFTNGYSIGNATYKLHGTNQKFGYYVQTQARAVGITPIANQNYVFTVTDSDKYQVNAFDISTLVDRGFYRGSKSVVWADSDSVTTSYAWVVLKKNDGTAFTEEELANGAEKVITITGDDKPIIKFINGYSGNYGYTINNTPVMMMTETTGRAIAQVPIANHNYVFTVTDPTKYQVAVGDVTTLDGEFCSKGNKTTAWGASDSASSDYVWLALKKLDGTDFTSEELSHGASAVFTYTYSS